MKLIFYYFVGISLFLISCDKKEENVEKKTIIENKNEPFYLINLPDTISRGIPTIFEIKLHYPNSTKGNYFSHLILSDSLEITLDNILKKAENTPSIDLPYDISEIETNCWEVRRTFNIKGDFVVKGGIFVHTMEFGTSKNDSIKVFEKQHVIPVEKKIYVK